MSHSSSEGTRRKSALEPRAASDDMEVEAVEEMEYFFPHVDVLEVDEDVQLIADFRAQPRSRRPPRRKRDPAGPARARSSVKMYELDLDLHPEAANARASYINRLKRKEERKGMLDAMMALEARNQDLENENKLLKEQLANLREAVGAGDKNWLTFFRDAGIKSGIDVTYALAFERNRVQREMLPTITERGLRNMKIMAYGDIFSILKHAREVCLQEGFGVIDPGTIVKPQLAPAATSTSTGPKIIGVRSLSKKDK